VNDTPHETTTGTTGRWTKAAASSGAGQCVEMRRRDGAIDVRDSKNPGGPALHFTKAEFSAWLDGAKKGEFDHLT
jgi:hypothetical protein